jgi:hypothetical protein
MTCPRETRVNETTHQHLLANLLRRVRTPGPVLLGIVLAIPRSSEVGHSAVVFGPGMTLRATASPLCHSRAERIARSPCPKKRGWGQNPRSATPEESSRRPRALGANGGVLDRLGRSCIRSFQRFCPHPPLRARPSALRQAQGYGPGMKVEKTASLPMSFQPRAPRSDPAARGVVSP